MMTLQECSSVQNSKKQDKMYKDATTALVLVLFGVFLLYETRDSFILLHPRTLLWPYSKYPKTDMLCTVTLAELGRLTLRDDLDSTMLYMEPLEGGTWYPKECNALQRVAVILFCRNRVQYLLNKTLKRLHSMLRHQKLHYTIFVIEQVAPSYYNSGKLRNVGFLESLKHGKYDCYVFHDMNLVPVNNQNLYMCDHRVRYLSSYHATCSSQSFADCYNVEDAISIRKDTYIKLNGYSNRYWGYRSDEDFYSRAMAKNITISRLPRNIGRYISLAQSPIQTSRVLNLRKQRRDGLTSKQMVYDVMSVKKYRMYTHIRVDLGILKKTGYWTES